MFSLLVGFWQAMFRKVEFQVLILGLDRAGKTSALEQMKAMFLGLDPLPAISVNPSCSRLLPLSSSSLGRVGVASGSPYQDADHALLVLACRGRGLGGVSRASPRELWR